MRLTAAIFSALIAAAVAAEPALAQAVTQPDGYARLGLARLRLADEGDIYINGTLDPNGGYTTPERWVANGDIGYFVLDNVAVQLSATSPATTPNMPAGSLEGMPNLGDDTFSVFSLTALFHPLRGATVSPYVGGGLALQHIWNIEDGFAQNLHVEDAVGPVVQGGVEVALGERFGLYLDARQAFITTDASADIGPNRITADAKLNPFIVQAGALVRF